MRDFADKARPTVGTRTGLGPWTSALWETALARGLRQECPRAHEALLIPARPSRRIAGGRHAAEVAWAAWALQVTPRPSAIEPFAQARDRVLGTKEPEHHAGLVRVRLDADIARQVDRRLAQIARRFGQQGEFSTVSRGMWRLLLADQVCVLDGLKALSGTHPVHSSGPTRPPS